MFSLPAALVAMAITGGGAGQTVLLDFYADWCGPCRSMNPAVEQLAAAGYPVRRVNIDQYHDLAQRFGITTIPCFVMIVDGKEADRVVGLTSIGRLQQLCSLGRRREGGAHPPGDPAVFPVAVAWGVPASLSPAAPNPMLAMPAQTAPAGYPLAGHGGTTGSGGPNVPVIPVSYATAAQRPPVTDAAMLAASVRLRVEDPQGHSCGSGTIIDARAGGEALVLTCGHLFRDSKGSGKIDVDVFTSGSAVRVPGRLLTYDLERDVGLVAFRPQAPVMVARVAPPDYPLRAGDTVTSVGCNNGADPTVQHSQVNSLDRFLDPAAQRGGSTAGGPHLPWNLQVAGQPVVGRSGGGLFSVDGMVIGVCNAAEPVDHEGLFAALGSIHAALDQQGLASLYKQAIAPPTMVPAVNNAHSAIAAVDPFSAGRMAAPQVRTPSQDAAAAAPAAIGAGCAVPRATTTDSGTTASGEQAVMDEIHRRVHDGPVKVYIVSDGPQAKSELITVDRDPPAAVKPYRLSTAGQSQNIPTSLEVPKRPTPILEWDVETGWRHQQPLP